MKSRTFKTIVFVIAAALPLCSCQKEIKYLHAGDNVRFTAGSGFAATKACYSGETNSDGSIERIDWQEGDLLRIYCGQASEPSVKYADYRVASVEDPTTGSAVSTAHIEVSSPDTDGIGLRWGEGEHTFYAAFPSPATTGGITRSISANEVEANLSATQAPVNVTNSSVNYVAVPDLRNMLMTAKAGPYTAETFPDENTVFLDFTPLTTAVTFTITNQTRAPLIIKSVSLTSASAPLNGPFTVDINDDSHQPEPIDLGGTPVSYTHTYPNCQYTGSTSDATKKTVTIDFEPPITLAYNADMANCGSLTFTFFLQPCQNFDDLTFKLVKSDGSWMSTRLGYTDGTGILFPRFKKSSVTGIFVPEGAQWTVKYGSLDQGTLAVTKWEKGNEGYLPLKPKNNDLLPGKFSVSADKYVQFSRGNLLATRSSSSSNDWKLGFFANQYDYGKATSFTANDTEMSLFTFGFDSKETSFDPIGSTPGSEDWGIEYNRQYGLLLGTWQTLTGGPGGEWWYLLDGRPNAANLKVFKTVHEHSNCLIILPDDFDLSDMPSSPKLTDAEWSDLEKKGAVCLPQAGYRNASTYSTISNGYWGNNLAFSSNGNGLFFQNGANVTSTTNGAINYGYSIRLVQKFDKSIIQPNFVDLGLQSGTLWADRNVGAMSEADYGYWYAWGEKSIHYTSANPATNSFEWKAGFEAGYANSTYSFFSGSSYTKYNDTDNIKTLQVADDVCSELYGTSCSVPNQDQWRELEDKCTKIWKGNGYEFVGPNGNKLFIPVNGLITETSISQYNNNGGYYWSKELNATDKGFSFHFGGSDDFYYSEYFRYWGLGVRAVKTTSN